MAETIQIPSGSMGLGRSKEQRIRWRPGLFIPSYCEVGFCHVLRETKIWQKHVMRDSLTSPLRLLLTGFECQQTKRKILWKKCQRFFHAMVMIDQT